MRIISNIKHFNSLLKITDDYGNNHIKKNRFFLISKMVACCLILSAPLNKATYAGGGFSCCQKVNKEENPKHTQSRPLVKSVRKSYVNDDIKDASTFTDNLSQEEINKASVFLLHRNAEKGDVRAQVLLAHNYQIGVDGIKKDEAKAEYWYRLAADQGNTTALKILRNKKNNKRICRLCPNIK